LVVDLEEVEGKEVEGSVSRRAAFGSVYQFDGRVERICAILEDTIDGFCRI